MKLVMIEWVDSQSFTRWVDYDGIDNNLELRCLSVGWLLHESADRIVIASHLSDSHVDDSDSPNQITGHMMIPRVSVRQMWELEEV